MSAAEPRDEGAKGLPSVVGARLRAERERQGISSRELAERIGVSASLVSMIENGRSNPSVATLYALVSALSISLDTLFSDPQDAPAERRATDPAEEGTVLRAPDRPVLQLASGVRWERLTPTEDPEADFLFLTYGVGGASCPPDAPLSHSGRDYVLLLEGRLGVSVGARSFELAPGDSIAFDGSAPHRLWTIGDRPAVAISFSRRPAPR